MYLHIYIGVFAKLALWSAGRGKSNLRSRTCVHQVGYLPAIPNFAPFRQKSFGDCPKRRLEGGRVARVKEGEHTRKKKNLPTSGCY